MKKSFKKIIPLSLTIGIFLSSSIGAFANVSEPVISNIVNIEVVNQLINNIEDEVEVTGEGLYSIDKNAIENEILNMDDKTLEILCIQGGFNSTDEVVNSLVAGIESVNEQIETREIVFIDEENLISSEDCDYYLQGGSTYDLTHWWGRTRYKSTYAANWWAADLNKQAALNAGTGVIAAAVFGGIGGIPNGLTSAYCLHLATNVSYYNSLSSRGIVAKITWALAYSMRTQ